MRKPIDPRVRAFAAFALLLTSSLPCPLLQWLGPTPAASDIQLTNEAVLATNAAIMTGIVATETAGARQASPTPTPDPCTGWWCVVSGAVYGATLDPGHELAGASVQLGQFSYCSPTRGESQLLTGSDGTFEARLFLHDTDRVWIQVESEGYASARWDATGFDCLYCSCFTSPIEILLHAAPRQ
jgi:hypothetical protein